MMNELQKEWNKSGRKKNKKKIYRHNEAPLREEKSAKGGTKMLPLA